MPKYAKFESSDDEDDQDKEGGPSLPPSATFDANYNSIQPLATANEPSEEPATGEEDMGPKVCVVKARRVSFHKNHDGIDIALNNQEEGTKRKPHSPLNEFELQLAATLVQDVRYSRSIDFEPTEKSLHSYKKYNCRLLRWGQFVVLLTNLGMALFERPALPGVAAMPYFISLIMELLCVGFYIFRYCHLWTFSNKERFWRDKKNQVLLVCIILTLIDILIFIIIQEADETLVPIWPRWSRPLRPLFLCNFTDSNQIRRAFRNIRRTIPDICNVLILFFMTVALFALLGVKLFGSKNLNDTNGNPYFVNYFDAVWDLYVLVTTANNPDIMMPAYDMSTFYSIFFVTYLIICLYLFMSIILAVIYNNYKKHLKNEVQKYVFRKRKKLSRAFEILKTWFAGRFVLTKARWYVLMEEVVPQRGKHYADLLWQVLDKDGDDVIEKKSFLNVVDLLNVGLSEVKDRQVWLDKFLPTLWNHKICQILRACVQHRVFRVFFDILIVVNAFVIGLVTDNDAQLKAEYVFLFLFSVEIFLKLFTFGSKHFFTRMWNVFDTVIIGAALVGTLIEAFANEMSYSRETLDTLMVLRVLRLVKIMGSIERFKIVIKTILNIGPSIFTYAAVCFVFFYIYAIIGMEFFADSIKFSDGGNSTVAAAKPEAAYCFNEKLKGSAFAMDNYCKVNFNNMGAAFVTLFTLMVVNQWHVIAEGFVLVTTKWARLYFFSFHLIVVILVLNIFTAFILEVFILEYSLGKGRLEFAIEQKIHELGLGLDQEKTREKMRNNGEEEATDAAAPASVTPVTETKEQNQGDLKYESFDEVVVGNASSAPPIAPITPPIERSFEQSDDDLQDLSQLSGIRFKLTKKKSRKTVEVMLQRLFEDELEEGEEGPEDDGEAQPEDDKPPAPFILRNILS